MTLREKGGSRGSHPHSDRPNWQPAASFDDYMRNCEQGLEDYSDRRAAKLLGWPRIEVYRAQLLAQLPHELFDNLLKAGVKSTKALAGVALSLNGKGQPVALECCPHCGERLRLRRQVSAEHARIVTDFLTEEAPP
jgi:hypothetical protein